MKKINEYYKSLMRGACLFLLFLSCINAVMGQDSAATENVAKTKPKPVKNTFEDIMVIDNQTLQVPIKKTFEFMLGHRFGTVTNGYKDFYGLAAGANMAFRFYYTPINNLSLGIAFNLENLIWEGNVKYALMRQSEKGGWPVSITYYGNIAVDTREKQGNFISDADRVSYFNQLMVGRKITEELSLQVSGSLSYLNNVPGYVDAEGDVSPLMNNAQFSMEFLGRYKISEIFSVIAEYNQPLTQNLYDNPHPSLGLGVEISTKGHSFQLFGTNYGSTLPQYNNFFNQNDYTKGMWLVGFNLSRRWHL